MPHWQLLMPHKKMPCQQKLYFWHTGYSHNSLVSHNVWSPRVSLCTCITEYEMVLQEAAQYRVLGI